MIQANKHNIDSLDGLRAFACLLVVFGHLAKEEIIFDIKGSGQLGVMLFFVLSGFLMAHLYATQAVTGKNLLEYSFRRCFRVLPAYVAMLFLSFLLTPYWKNFPYAMDVTGLIKHLKFQGDTSVFWTIPVEMKFYLVFPLLWFILQNLSKPLYKTTLAFIVFLYCINVFPLANTNRLDLTRYIGFFMGGVSAGLIHQYSLIHVQWQRYLVNALFVLSIILILIFIPQVFLKLTGIVHNMWNMPQVLAPLFAICVLLAANISGFMNRLFANGLARFLGNISFSLYLVHLPVIVFINQLDLLLTAPVLFKILLSLAISVFLAYVLYRVVENPFRKIGVRLNNVVSRSV